ncbi:MAG: hypothetical protein H7Z75_16815 [Ferruginibacter sp.]|nr:hypothetical protein [Cytophagales bacterium]
MRSSTGELPQRKAATAFATAYFPGRGCHCVDGNPDRVGGAKKITATSETNTGATGRELKAMTTEEKENFSAGQSGGGPDEFFLFWFYFLAGEFDAFVQES